jgi:Transmembrane domain of unknown function (DUF3566)
VDDRATAVTASPAASQAAAARAAPAAPATAPAASAAGAATAPRTEAPPTSAPARPTEHPDTVHHPGPDFRSPSAVEAARGAGTGETARTTAAGPPAQRHGPHRIRKARLRLLRIDAWSVMKTAFLLSIAASATLVVAVGVLWSVLDAAGVFSAVGDVVRDVTSSESNPGFSVEEYLGFSRVIGFSILIAVIDVVLITALATLGAFLYNLSASLLGGLEVTLAEDD